MGRIGKRKMEAISFFLVLSLLSSLLAGCSNSKTASANLDQKLELAIKYLSEQKYEQAVLAYQEVIKIDNKNVTAYKGLSLAFVLQEKPDKAEQAIQDGLKALVNNEQLQLAMAGLMLDRDKADKAEAIYKELINADNPTLSSYQAYTYYLSKQGKQAEAIALLEKAVAKNNKDYKLDSMLAELYFETGDHKKALVAINKSLAQQLDQSTAYKLLAEMYNDQWDELVALGDQYIQQNQAKTGQLLKLSALLGMGKYEDLIKLYGELPAELKNDGRARFIAAQAYSKLGKKDQYLGLMKQIKTADLKDAGMLADLANFYLENGDKDNARKLALQGIAADGTVMENYSVIYKSYMDEDKSLAQMWAYKYVLASSLSYKDGLSKLADYDLESDPQKQSKDKLTAQEIVAAIIRDQSSLQKWLEKNKNLPHQLLSQVYLDTKNNIAYRGYCDKENNWNPIIIKHHSPVLYTLDGIPANIIAFMEQNGSEGWKKNWQSIKSKDMGNTRYILADSGKPQGKVDWAYAVIIEGDIPLEEHIKRAGYPIENITFVDM